MARIASGLAIVVLALGSRIAVTAQSVSGTAQPPLAGEIEKLVTPFISPSRVPGISLSVVRNGETVYARGFGSITIDTVRPATVHTQYRLASVSKPFTAAAVFLLVQDGVVKLDEPARTYCAQLSALNGAPTVRHFLTHRSGMRHTTDSEDTTITGPAASYGVSISRVVKEPLRFVPGARTLYSSWGYAVLGCVIESVTRTSYADFMRNRVIAPAGLVETTFDRPDYTAPEFSQGFRGGLIYGLRPSIVVDTRFKTPASGLISTTSDMARFASALLDGRLIRKDLVAEMFRVQRDGEGKVGFTAGWTPQGLSSLGPVFDYNGSMEGVTAFLEVVPDQRYALALLANRERFVPELQPIVTGTRQRVLSPR